MRMKIVGRKMTVADDVRDYAEEKIGRAAKMVDAEPMNADIILHQEKNPAIERKAVAEVTVTMKGRTVHVEEHADTLLAAIDLVAEKLERRLRKYKDRLMDDRQNGKVRLKTVSGDLQLEQELAAVALLDNEITEEPQLVKRKEVELKPMTVDEAMLQIELLGHDFFVFSDVDSESVSVLYRRRDGDYGLIEPSLG